MKAARKITAFVLIALMTFTAMPRFARAETEFYVSDLTELANALKDSESGDSIRLLQDIDYYFGILITGKRITLDLHGKKLNLTVETGMGLEVGAGGELHVWDGSDEQTGAFSVSTGGKWDYGVYAHDGGIATVTNVKATGEFGVGAYAEGSGSRVFVLGSAEGATGVWASGPNSAIQVSGSVTSSHEGVKADDYANIYVSKNVTVDGEWAVGLSATNGGETSYSNVTVGGDVTVSGKNAMGAAAFAGGRVTVEGDLTVSGLSAMGISSTQAYSTVYVEGAFDAPDDQVGYITLSSGIVAAADGTEEDGYVVYTDGAGSVYIRGTLGEVCSIGDVVYDKLGDALKVAIDDAAPGAVTTIKLLKDIEYEKSIEVAGKTLIFDLNHHSLAVGNFEGNGLTVGAGGVVDVTDTSDKKDGVFTAGGMGYGVYAHDGGQATVHVTMGMHAGVRAENGSTVHVKTTAAGSLTGVLATGGSTVTIDGDLMLMGAGTYIQLGETVKAAGEGVLGDAPYDSYLVYSEGGNTVRVKVSAVCRIGEDLYDTLGDALAAVDEMPEGSEATITLLADIEHTRIVLADRTVTFDLRGHTLDVENPEGHGVEVGEGGKLLLAENELGGKLNAASGDEDFYGVYAHDGGQATVSSVTANGTAAYAEDANSSIRVKGDALGVSLGDGAYAEGGARVVVDGDVTGTCGAYAEGKGSSVEIKGGITDTGYGVFVMDEGAVKVHKSISALGNYKCGILAMGSGSTVEVGKNVTVSGENVTGIVVAEGASVAIGGGVTVTGAGACGIQAVEGGTAVIEGVFAAPEAKYIMLIADEEHIEDALLLTAGNGEPGETPYQKYLVYTDDVNHVYLKIQVKSAAVGPASGSFDKNPAKEKDVTAAITWNDARSVQDVKAGAGSIGAGYYTVKDNTLTIKKEYLRTAGVGNLTLTIEFDAGDSAELTIAIETTTVIAGLPDVHTLYLNGRITWNPTPAGGTWDWDEEFFTATFNSPATFRARKAGTSTITYTVGGVTQSITVTILHTEMPITGQSSFLPWALAVLAVLCGAAGALPLLLKKKGR